MIFEYEIEAEIATLQEGAHKAKHTNPKLGAWVQKRVNLLTRLLIDWEEVHTLLTKKITLISELQAKNARLDLENSELKNALIVAKKTLENV